MTTIQIYDSEAKRLNALAEASGMSVADIMGDYMDSVCASFTDFIYDTYEVLDIERYKRIMEEQ